MVKGWQRYHTIWLMLFLGWIFSYADRTLTGPAVICGTGLFLLSFTHFEGGNKYLSGWCLSLVLS